MINWKMEVKTGGKWSTNSCTYSTEQEALNAGKELLSRWTVPSDYRAVETNDPVNYEFNNGRSNPI